MRREQPSNPSLELVGLLLLFLTMPELLRGRHVVLRVDNRSVDHAWGNKTVKPDIGASALVRALMIVRALLECQLYVGHTKQYTMAGSYLANCLTRDTTASGPGPQSRTSPSRTPYEPVGLACKPDYQLAAGRQVS